MKSLLLTAVATLGLTAATMAQSVPSYVPTNGLVGWWPFNGNANDESGNGNNGVPTNGVSLTTDRFGNNNSAYIFDGINDRIEIADAAALRCRKLSLSVWVLMNPAGNGQIIYKGNLTSAQSEAYSLNGNVLFSIKINSNCIAGQGWKNSPFNQSLGQAQWHHIVSTFDGATTKNYYDGVFLTSNAYNGLIDSCLNSNLRFGYNHTLNNNGNPWNGKIDDIGIWNRALTQQEITDLFNAMNCANNTTITPQTNSLSTGSTATLTASTTDPNPSYVWQSDFGQGFQTLNNFGNYSGTSTATLNVANVQLSEHNQPIRVISTSGNCIDTSNVAIISITDTCINTITDTTLITVTDTLVINTTITSVNPPNNANTIKIFPNPTNDHITIDYGNFSIMNGYQLKIENSIGQQVFQTNISQQSDYLNLATWGGNGLYFVHIKDPQGNTIDIRKIVLQ